jgi:hypothetical protein
VTSVRTSSHEPAVLGREELFSMYEAYRRRQIRGLVSMLPREAIRPLYRAALEARGTAASPGDPLEALVDHCSGLLPLPTFEVWADDLARFPTAHLRDLDDSFDGPTPAKPAAIAVRDLRIAGESWRAKLRVFRAEGAWRGFIAFEGVSVGDDCRTAVIFREATPEDLRERFVAFDGHALGAFLRSCLP